MISPSSMDSADFQQKPQINPLAVRYEEGTKQHCVAPVLRHQATLQHICFTAPGNIAVPSLCYVGLSEIQRTSTRYREKSSGKHHKDGIQLAPSKHKTSTKQARIQRKPSTSPCAIQHASSTNQARVMLGNARIAKTSEETVEPEYNAKANIREHLRRTPSFLTYVPIGPMSQMQ